MVFYPRAHRHAHRFFRNNKRQQIACGKTAPMWLWVMAFGSAGGGLLKQEPEIPLRHSRGKGRVVGPKVQFLPTLKGHWPGHLLQSETNLNGRFFRSGFQKCLSSVLRFPGRVFRPRPLIRLWDLSWQ